MSRHAKTTPAAATDKEDQHAAYAALMARLVAFGTELSAQGKTRATAMVPEPTFVMAADLMAQIARLMTRAVEARGLPRLEGGAPVTFSEATIAFAQAHHAFEAFGKRKGFNKPVPDAEAKREGEKLREEVMDMMNRRILTGIRDGWLVPLSATAPDDDAERERESICKEYMALVTRMEAYTKRAYPRSPSAPR